MRGSTSGGEAGRRGPVRSAYTLLEILVVVTVLGIAGALIVPSMGQTGVLRVQAAVRTIVADITFAQSDALAYQRRRAIVFTPELNTYVLVEVNGTAVNPATDAMYDADGPNGRYQVTLDSAKFAGARIDAAVFDGGSTLIFDEMGGPVLAATGDTPSAGGTITVTGSGATFEIRVEAYTGRVTVNRITGP
jgi:prepilin-type N-terminal cleavage/methylation domain-containing protein